MKNTLKILGIIAIAVIIGFVMTSCATTKEAAPEKEAPASSVDYTALPETEWPAADVWGRYGLTGLKQPEGSTVVGYPPELVTQFQVILINITKASFDNINAQINAMAGFSKIAEETDKNGDVTIGYMAPNMTNMIAVSHSPTHKAIVISIH